MSKLSNLYAKSPVPGGETLEEHTLQVVKRLGEMKHRMLHLGKNINVDSFWEILFWSAWFHDFGKIASGFQEMLSTQTRWHFRHEVLSLAFLEWVFDPKSSAYAIASAAIAAHHRDYKIIDELYICDPEDSCIAEKWSNEVELWKIEVLAEWTLKEAIATAAKIEIPLSKFLPRNIDPLQTHQTAVERILRALEAYQQYYLRQANTGRRQAVNACEFRQEALLVRGIILQSDRLASAAAPSLKAPALPNLLHTMPKARKKWYKHQIDSAQSTGSAILTAPTGSGKTEASLLWSIKQQEEDRNGAIFYLLPFKASINAMHERIIKRYKVPKEEVALMHSHAVQAIYRSLLAKENLAVKEARSQAKRQKSLGKLHQQPICIATPYQLLRAAFRLPGYEGQWAMFYGSHLIIDEIHGYESKRLGLLLELFKTLKEKWDTRIFCMTATMPTWLREKISDTLQVSNCVTANKQLFEEFTRHRLHLLEGKLTDEGLLEEVCKQVKVGKKVLVVANQVSSAQYIADELRKKLDEKPIKPKHLLKKSSVHLLHSRFTSEDRLEKELALMEKVSPRKRKGFVAVATQVVEVSLDVDFNTIYTEPAPLEALLQRFGRVNRRRKYAELPVYVVREAIDWQYPYQNEDLLKRTVELLAKYDGDIVDEAKVDSWLDVVYKPDVERLLAEVEEGRQAYQSICGEDQLVAFESDPEVRNQFNELFDGYEILPKPLYNEFISRLEAGRKVEAYNLCVPISSIRFKILWANQQITRLEEHRLLMAHCEYDKLVGLTFPTKKEATIKNNTEKAEIH